MILEFGNCQGFFEDDLIDSDYFAQFQIDPSHAVCFFLSSAIAQSWHNLGFKIANSLCFLQRLHISFNIYQIPVACLCHYQYIFLEISNGS
jgi:hypothetical protein